MRADDQPAALPSAAAFRFAIVVSRFHETITGSLRAAAIAALKEMGATEAHVEVLPVPGAFEIPQAARAAAETGRFDAIVCLGCIVRGETPHFDYIASAVALGIMTASGDTGIPMAFGVLTTNTVEQARARAGNGPDNKGREAAAAAVEMAALHRRLSGPPVRPPTIRT